MYKELIRLLLTKNTDNCSTSELNYFPVTNLAIENNYNKSKKSVKVYFDGLYYIIY